MAETPEPSAATGLPPVPHDRGALPPGTIINNTYEIEERISAGGMGEVYRACHRERRQSKVAIKVMLPSLEQDEQMIALFKAEAEALERTRHEAVVGYRGDFLDPALGRRVLVMEFVAGEPLSRRMRTAPLTEDECLSLLRRVATGLALAHDEGVVHRDLKPANIILEKGKVSRAKLIDFGIAKMTRMDGEGSVIGSRVAGTYTFMSPEHLGMYGKVDRRSDIYSLALVVAAAARGTALPMGESPFECIECRKVVPDLSEIGPRLRPVLAAMLAPRPEDRPQDMVAVLDLVEAAISEGAAGPAPAAPPRPGGDDAGSGVAPSAQRDTGVSVQTPAPTSAPPLAPPAPPQADPGSLAPTSLGPASLAPTSISPASLAPSSAVPPAAPGQPPLRPPVPPGAADLASLAPTPISPASALPTSLAPTSFAPPVTRDAPGRPGPLAEAPPTVISIPPAPERAGPPSTPGPVVTGVPDWSPPPEPASAPGPASRPARGAGAASPGGKPASKAPLLIVAGLALAGVVGGVALIGLPGGREPAPPAPADPVPQITDVRPQPQPPVAPVAPEPPADTAAVRPPDAGAPPGPAVPRADPAPDVPADSRIAALGPKTAPPPDPVQPSERQAEPAPDPAMQPPAPADPAPPAPEPPGRLEAARPGSHPRRSRPHPNRRPPNPGPFRCPAPPPTSPARRWWWRARARCPPEPRPKPSVQPSSRPSMPAPARSSPRA